MRTTDKILWKYDNVQGILGRKSGPKKNEVTETRETNWEVNDSFSYLTVSSESVTGIYCKPHESHHHIIYIFIIHSNKILVVSWSFEWTSSLKFPYQNDVWICFSYILLEHSILNHLTLMP